MIIKNIINELLEQYELGVLIQKPVLMTGGDIHASYHVITSKRELVVKQINPYVSEKSDFLSSSELSERIANRFSIAGIPAVAALHFNGTFLLSKSDHYFIIYPYINGRLVYGDNVSPMHATAIGQIFALLHTTKISINYPNDESFHYQLFCLTNLTLSFALYD